MSKAELNYWTISELWQYVQRKIGAEATRRLMTRSLTDFRRRFYRSVVTDGYRMTRFPAKSSERRKKLLMIVHALRDFKPTREKVACCITGQAPGHRYTNLLLKKMP